MHTFLLFFGWPGGATWGNVGAMPLCGAVAAVAAFIFRDHLGRAMRHWFRRHFGHGDELDDIKARLDSHADLLDPATPGGLAAVLAEAKRAASAAEAAFAGVQALAALATAKPAPKRGDTEMRKTGGGKTEPAPPAGPAGMGSRVPPKRDRM